MTLAKDYTEMKDSGIDIIGKIPTHWNLCRLRFLCRITTGNQDTQNAVEDGIYPFYVRSPKIERANSYTFDGESVLMAGDGAGAGKVFHHAFGKYAIHQRVYCFFDFKNIVPRYFYYFVSNLFSSEIDKGSAKSTVASVRLPMLQNFILCLPTTKEQTYIAAYLDTQCAKIDEIIAQAKASIEDYKQWKMSVVNDAVTHGLDPNAEMKDSGIYWMGKIPTKWGLKRLKYIFAIKKDIAGELGHTVLAITQQGIKPKNMSDKGQFALDYSKYQLVVPGDFAMNHMDLLTGWVDISQHSGVTSPDYRVFFALHPEEIDTNYYKHVFQTCYRCRIFYGLGQGVSGLGRWRLPAEMFLNFVLPVPPLDEQRKIGEFLDKQCAKIDDLIIEKQSLIDDLESYKKSLIYEVVTGKRRITEPHQMTIAVLSPDILRYQKALLMLRILDLLGNEARGRIHLQKCMFAAECLLNIPFQTQYIRYDHGPYDLHLADYETVLCDSGWFNIQKGSHVTYQKSRHFAEGLKEYMNVFSDIDEKLKHIVAFLKPMKTTQAERVATLLAAWNDFIIDGISHPTDKEIINEVMSNWTPNKANPQYSTWQDTLTKIRKNRFIPSGFGIHTLKKEVLLQEE